MPVKFNDEMLIVETDQLKRFYAKNRIWQGIPGIERTKNGRFFSTFYSGGVKEELGNYVVLLKSEDGENWSEPIAVAYHGQNYRCYDPCLWIDPLGRLWFIWSMMPEHAVYASICDDPDADVLSWSKEFKIGNDVMMNKPTVLSTGEWLFPIAVWNHNIFVQCETKAEKRGSFVYRTIDNGKTFSILGYADVPLRSFDEHMLLELTDGRLMMLVRTNYGIGVSYSWDRGATWSVGTDSKLGGPRSRFFIRRLTSGRVLLINHYHYNGRNNLTALLSDDDCATWKWHLLLDERDNVAYPDATIGEDGFIYIIYDRERGGFKHSLNESQQDAREILMAKITEEDIINGKLVNEQSKLKCIVNKLGKYEGEDKNPYGIPRNYSALEHAEILAGYDSKEKILEEIFDNYSIECQTMHRIDTKQLNKLIIEFMLLENTIDTLVKILEFLKAVPSDKQSEKPIVNSVIHYVHENINEDISITDIADTLHISVFYMCHLFKKETGTSIVDFRNTLRLSNAKRMLVSSDLPISEIAEKCGLKDVSYFSKIFKRVEDMTPKEYREFNKRNFKTNN